MLKLLLTCEHGGNQIPPEYSHLFEDRTELLQSHQGYDIGALDLFRVLQEIADFSFYSETSRLLIELNRSLNHGKLFSEVTRVLPEEEKRKIIQAHYVPYRSQVEQLVDDFISAGRTVLHLSVHTFTPVLNGEERQADIGLLYDSRKKEEQTVCREWKKAIAAKDKGLLVRYNYPYLGTADGFTTYLRRKFDKGGYIGVELEVNQKFPLANQQHWEQIKHLLRDTLAVNIAPQRVDPTGI
ncbi:N-formylglutamate amidohydrolase [Pontibacter sp. SGAir0037]|uniref:N-formylglutamate amidohydrolase n=1 Tax=Pontibacter sp. SGAir0037 TaxID=2571030 RepID=UPI0010CCD270|nr:N-formylglutamate amidohydrolase [Pontibacter sp. SGAir0037]QCR21897.1 N-formylglutamate amidohydrolase [Pontibacter sp. SGAir0037]